VVAYAPGPAGASSDFHRIHADYNYCKACGYYCIVFAGSGDQNTASHNELHDCAGFRENNTSAENAGSDVYDSNSCDFQYGTGINALTSVKTCGTAPCNGTNFCSGGVAAGANYSKNLVSNLKCSGGTAIGGTSPYALIWLQGNSNDPTFTNSQATGGCSWRPSNPNGRNGSTGNLP
jgi:hypothetical protein